MAVRDHLNRTPKLRAKITTVDPSQGIIEVVTVDGRARRLANFDSPAFFRWPVQGEEWTIYEENGHWVLGSRYPSNDDAIQASALQPGEALAAASAIYDTNGARLAPADLSDISDGEMLIWDEALGRFVPETVGGGGGGVVDATTTVKGILKLAGDLAGTAALPLVASGAITDTKVAAANKDGAAGTASMRTLGTGAQQAAAGNHTHSTLPTANEKAALDGANSPSGGNPVATIADVGSVTHKYTSATHSSGTIIAINQSTHGITGPGLIVQVQEVTTGDVPDADINVDPVTSNVTVTFAVSRSANSIRVTILG